MAQSKIKHIIHFPLLHARKGRLCPPSTGLSWTFTEARLSTQTPVRGCAPASRGGELFAVWTLTWTWMKTRESEGSSLWGWGCWQTWRIMSFIAIHRKSSYCTPCTPPCTPCTGRAFSGCATSNHDDDHGVSWLFSVSRVCTCVHE